MARAQARSSQEGKHFNGEDFAGAGDVIRSMHRISLKNMAHDCIDPREQWQEQEKEQQRELERTQEVQKQQKIEREYGRGGRYL